MVDVYWPLPRLSTKKPVVSQEFRAGSHEGVDVMYWWVPGDDEGPPHSALSRDHKPVFTLPVRVPVLAVAVATVVYAKRAPNGFRVRLSHPSGLHTLYLHMTCLFVRIGEAIKAGQPLGIAGGDETDLPNKTVHLHHEHRVLVPPGVHGDGWGRMTADPMLVLRAAEYVDVP